MRRLVPLLFLSMLLSTAACDDHDHSGGGTCGEHGKSHGDHCHCNAGYTERDGVCVVAGDASAGQDASSVDAAAVADGEVHDHDAEVEACGGHGHLHGSECHCDDGYVASGSTCVVAPACMSEDRHEPNNASSEATPWMASYAHETLRVCAGRPDWFRIPVGVGQTLTVRATFTHAHGDIDLGLWPVGVDTVHRAPVARADGTVDNETLRYTATTGGDFWLGVIVYGRGDLPYTLSVETTP